MNQKFEIEIKLLTLLNRSDDTSALLCLGSLSIHLALDIDHHYTYRPVKLKGHFKVKFYSQISRDKFDWSFKLSLICTFVRLSYWLLCSNCYRVCCSQTKLFSRDDEQALPLA